MSQSRKKPSSTCKTISRRNAPPDIFATRLFRARSQVTESYSAPDCLHFKVQVGYWTLWLVGPFKPSGPSINPSSPFSPFRLSFLPQISHHPHPPQQNSPTPLTTI